RARREGRRAAVAAGAARQARRAARARLGAPGVGAHGARDPRPRDRARGGRAVGPTAGARRRRSANRGSAPSWFCGSERGEALGHRRLAVGRLVLVDDALARGLVQRARRGALQLDGLLGVACLGGLAELPHGGTHGGLDRLVAQAALLVGLDPLDLTLDVGHANASSFFPPVDCSLSAPAAGIRSSRRALDGPCYSASDPPAKSPLPSGNAPIRRGREPSSLTTAWPPPCLARYIAASAAASAAAGSPSSRARTTPIDVVTPAATSPGSRATAAAARRRAAVATGSGVAGMTTTNSSPP